MGFELINKIKKQRKWTNDDLARESGVPKATIDKITSGTTTNPSFDTVWAIAEALGCSVDDFKEKKSPEAAGTAPEDSKNKITAEELESRLIAHGFIKPGQDLEDRDLEFLISVGNIIKAWFDGRQ